MRKLTDFLFDGVNDVRTIPKGLSQQRVHNHVRRTVPKDYLGRHEGPIEGRHQNQFYLIEGFICPQSLTLHQTFKAELGIDVVFGKQQLLPQFQILLSFRVF